MLILKNSSSFYELINLHQLKLPKNLTEARRVVRYGSCRPSSYWDYDFTDSDEKELGKHLASIFDGKITSTFIANFAVRFLSIAQNDREEITERKEE